MMHSTHLVQAQPGEKVNIGGGGGGGGIAERSSSGFKVNFQN